MANVSVEFVTTTKAKLDSLQIKDGQLIALSDEDAMFYDMENTRHAVIGDGLYSVVEGIPCITYESD